MSMLTPLIGGILIQLSASGLLLINGRIAGISGVFGGLLRSWNEDTAWRLAFVVGLLAGGALLLAVAPQVFAPPPR